MPSYKYRNIEITSELTASELISKIEDACKDMSINTDDCVIEIDKNSIDITSKETFWPDEY